MDRRTVVGGLVASAGLASCSLVDDINDAREPVDQVGNEDDEITDGHDEAIGEGEASPTIPPRLVDLGPVEELRERVRSSDNMLYVPEARSWVVEYPAEHAPAARRVYPEELWPSLKAGFLALYQKCPHLGCRIPACGSSQQFECPCHGSMYSLYGEKIAGPAPRGMDLFPLIIESSVTIDSSRIVEGRLPGTDVTGWAATNPGACIGDL